MYKERVIKSVKKEKICENCGEKIEVGESALKIVETSDRKLTCFYTHENCNPETESIEDRTKKVSFFEKINIIIKKI